MSRKLSVRTLFGLICLIGLASCVKPGTKITTNVAPDYQKTVKRLFVITSIGPEIGNKQFGAFQSAFSTALKGCGIDIDYSRRSPLDLDQNAENAALRNFNPDVVLTMVQQSSRTLTSGYVTEVTNITYNLQLVDMPNGKAVWRANIDFAPRADIFIKDNGGELLGNNLFQRMKQDGVLRSCSAI